MRRSHFLLITTILLVSCLNDFEPNGNVGFQKVYGPRSDPFDSPGGILKINEGFLIYGEMIRPVDNTDELGYPSPIEDTDPLPTIIKTDKLGNEMMRKTIPIPYAEFNNHSVLKGEVHQVYHARIYDMIELPNRRFFAVWGINIDPGFPSRYIYWSAYTLMDEQFEILEFEFFSDFEVNSTQLEDIESWGPRLFKVPNSTDFLIIFSRQCELKSDANCVSDSVTNHALYRMNDQGGLIWRKSYPREEFGSPGRSAGDLTFDENGNVVILIDTNRDQCPTWDFSE